MTRSKVLKKKRVESRPDEPAVAQIPLAKSRSKPQFLKELPTQTVLNDELVLSNNQPVRPVYEQIRGEVPAFIIFLNRELPTACHIFACDLIFFTTDCKVYRKVRIKICVTPTCL